MGAIFKNSKIVGWLPSACFIRFMALQEVICAEKHYYQWDLFLWRPLARAQKGQRRKVGFLSRFTNLRDDASFYFAQNKRAVVNIRPTSDSQSVMRRVILNEVE